jgi:hypothetical protein
MGRPIVDFFEERSRHKPIGVHMSQSWWSFGERGKDLKSHLSPNLQLTVVEALVEATLDESYHDILKATQLLVFFGTPHQGGNLATVGDYVAKLYRAMSRSPRNDLVEALKADSDAAAKRFEQFRHKHEDFLVISCYEGRHYSKAAGLVS